MTGQNPAELMIQQFEELIYPALQNRYDFRKAHNRACWYVSLKDEDHVYALIYDGDPPGWRVTDITGREAVRREIEAEVRALCPANL